MIIGNMSEAALGFNKYPEAVKEALQFLHAHDFTTMEDGTYEIHGKDSYAILQRYETKLPGTSKPEAHRKYIDVQYIVEGREDLGWCPLNPELKTDISYNDEKDIIFYQKLIPSGSVLLEKGSFAVLYPYDVHRPCGAIDNTPAPVTKVVVKIAVDYAK